MSGDPVAERQAIIRLPLSPAVAEPSRSDDRPRSFARALPASVDLLLVASLAAGFFTGSLAAAHAAAVALILAAFSMPSRGVLIRWGFAAATTVAAVLFEQGMVGLRDVLIQLPFTYGVSAVVIALAARDRRARAAAEDAYAQILAGMNAVFEAADADTGAHQRLVAKLGTAVGRRLGLGDAQLGELAVVASLHDIGKIGIPREILRKPGPLSAADWDVMKRHPEIGERILAAVPHFARHAAAVRHEHERYDGSGYPDGLRGHEIPLVSQIVFTVDAYAALTTDRVYRKAMTPSEALSEIMRGRETQFAPAVVDALVAEFSDRRLVIDAEAALDRGVA